MGGWLYGLSAMSLGRARLLGMCTVARDVTFLLVLVSGGVSGE